MKIVIKISPEIIIKSKPVRKRTIRLLSKNIKIFLEKFDWAFSIFSLWDKIELELYENISEKNLEEIKSILWDIPWIYSFYEVIEQDFVSLEDLFEKIKDDFLEKLIWKTFAVRVKRSWLHNFNSVEAERQIWAMFLRLVDDLKVNLDCPQVKIEIEIKDKKFYVLNKKYFWTWGYPVWFQSRVLSLISWWFDSSISSYLTIKRWCELDYLFFNFWSKAHENWVKQVSNYLWNKFSKNYDSKIIVVDFENIIKEILTKIDHRFRAIILKRLMLKCASHIWKDVYKALVKWDSLWQVSSQTLDNMSTINKASEMLVLRPLITYDKQEIIDLTKKIWTFNFASNMPEYCWVVSDKPATKSDETMILKEEEKMDKELIFETFNKIKVEKLKDFVEHSLDDKDQIEIVYLPWDNDVVIDIREKEKIKDNPINLKNINVLNIPFYEINHTFEKLDKTKTYLLYCEKWVLSKLHALYLKEKWFNNIKILRLDRQKVSCAS